MQRRHALYLYSNITITLDSLPGVLRGHMVVNRAIAQTGRARPR